MKFSKNEAIENLKEIKEVFDHNNIPFWLEDGTLLGAIRDKGIIPWDTDIDLGSLKEFVNNNSIRKKLTKELAEKNFSIYFFNRVMNINKKNSTIDVIMPEIDRRKKVAATVRFISYNSTGLFLVRMEKLCSLVYYGGFNFNKSQGKRDMLKMNFFTMVHHTPKKLRKYTFKLLKFILSPFSRVDTFYLTVPLDYYKKLKTIDYYDLKSNIPKDPEKYLEKKYGEWRKPPKDPEKWIWWEHGDWKKLGN